MIRLSLSLALLLAVARGVRAEDARKEQLSGWKYYQEVQLPARKDRAGRVALTITPAVFASARRDLGDLRLVDGAGSVVPYALRERRERREQQEVSAKEFNRVSDPDGSVQLALDLGESPGEHNQVAVLTSGSNYRRLARLEGSADGKKWRVVRDRVSLLDVRAGGQVVEVRTIDYPPSRFRYLRVQVAPDPGLGRDQPEIVKVHVRRTVDVPGKTVVYPLEVAQREALPVERDPGSVWVLHVSGGAAPLFQIDFEVEDETFSRPYYIEVERPGGGWNPIGSGTWQRLAGEKVRPLVARFSETQGSRFRLNVVDHRNPPLRLQTARSTGYARELVFVPGAKRTEPLRLYYGNPEAGPPNYDFAATLPEVLTPTPAQAELRGPEQFNQEYVPPPIPWTERRPGLVYAVLGLAAAALLAILGLLARDAVRRHDAASESPAI